MPRISFITIGGELLRGRIVNTNTTEVGKMLRAAGFDLGRNVSIPDDPATIQATLRQEWSTNEVILTSGGLGPTHDDLTKETLAAFFDTELVLHKPSLRSLEERFALRGKTVSERNRQQAMLPAACQVIPNPKGTAPGMLFEKEGKYLISMPGVPFELLHMVEHAVVPLLKSTFASQLFMHKTLRLRKVPESQAALRVESMQDQMAPEIEIAYLPRHDGLWLELGIRTPETESELALKKLQAATKLAEENFGDQVYAQGEDTLGQLLAKSLQEKKLTIAVAESMTGGLVAAKIVAVSGSSTYFEGSITAYHIHQKIHLLGIDKVLFDTHDVVSGEVAEAMAAGVREVLKTDLGLATTGLAEKDVATNALPQVWLGFADQDGTSSQHVELYHDRNVNRERAANQALIFVLQMLSKKD